MFKKSVFKVYCFFPQCA